MRHLKKFEENLFPQGGLHDDDDDFEPEEKENLISNGWEFRDMIEKCIEKNCKEIRYEGTEVDKRGILEDIIESLNKKYIISKK